VFVEIGKIADAAAVAAATKIAIRDLITIAMLKRM
jgi:hypothetical protein